MKIQVPVVEQIKRKILQIREQKVMLSTHLAELYGVETRALNQAVKRNISRFPKISCFSLPTPKQNNWYHKM
ncbi:MAG: ORF6N domain-containing protein [Pseudomonadota bacterium]